MILWVILTVLTAVSVAVLTIPLVRRHEARADARTATIAVLRDQLADVDVQLAGGTIPPGDAEALRIEIKRRMLAAGHIVEYAAKSLGSRALAGVAIGLAALVALAAGGLYSSMGKPGMSDVTITAQPVAAAPTAQDAEVAGLIGALETKIAANPKDPVGWRMLGWSYSQTGRFAEAATAYGKAAALDPQGEGYQSAYGEALTMAANGNVTPDARQAFEKAVVRDGGDARARFFLGEAKQQGGDAKGAIADWLTLLGDSAADAPWVPQLRTSIETAAKQAGIDVTARLAAVKQPASGGASVAAPPSMAGGSLGPSAAQVADAQGMAPADQQAMIAGMVDRLAARLATNPKDEDGWVRLIRARGVLGDKVATAKARDAALQAFSGNAAASERIRVAAGAAGV